MIQKLPKSRRLPAVGRILTSTVSPIPSPGPSPAPRPPSSMVPATLLNPPPGRRNPRGTALRSRPPTSRLCPLHPAGQSRSRPTPAPEAAPRCPGQQTGVGPPFLPAFLTTWLVMPHWSPSRALAMATAWGSPARGWWPRWGSPRRRSMSRCASLTTTRRRRAQLGRCRPSLTSRGARQSSWRCVGTAIMRRT